MNDGNEEHQGEGATSGKVLAIDDDQFDPRLIPDTTTIYSVQGAEIQKIEILDVEGRVVNVLRPGGDYQFVISGRFLSDIERFYFGIHIRSISGTVITGQRYPEEGKYIERMGETSNFRIVFGFKMILLAGVYFVGGGIWSSGGQTCSHRILDAIMFRLVTDKTIKSFGYMDASTKEPCLELF